LLLLLSLSFLLCSFALPARAHPPSLEWCWVLGGYPKRFDIDAIREKSKAYEQSGLPFAQDIEEYDKEGFLEYLNNPDQKKYSGWWMGEPRMWWMGDISTSLFHGPTEELGVYYEAFYLFPFLLVF